MLLTARSCECITAVARVTDITTMTECMKGTRSAMTYSNTSPDLHYPDILTYIYSPGCR